MARLSDTDVSGDAPAALPGDGLRDGIVASLRDDLGEGLVETHLVPQTDLWVRVSAEVWDLAGAALKAQGFEFFGFLSAIDWMPSPYGKSEEDPMAEVSEQGAGDEAAMKWGYTGGSSRFQLIARVVDVSRHVGVTVKADVPDSLTMPTWIPHYAGANWHERETHEMFGIGFDGHPDLRNLYLPTDFEGYPLRKDFPLLARLVKPWPGFVDVEPMPEPDDEGGDS